MESEKGEVILLISEKGLQRVNHIFQTEIVPYMELGDGDDKEGFELCRAWYIWVANRKIEFDKKKSSK